MQFWIFLIGFCLTSAQIPQRYGTEHRLLSQGQGSSQQNLGSQYRGDNEVGSNHCGPGKLPNAIGECVEPIINRNLFVYAAPPLPPVNPGPLPEIPTPIIDYNVVFVRTPDPHNELPPIVIPPPQKKTLVYVLTETGEIEQRVIEVPTKPSAKPEVIYVNYAEGDNPTLRDDVTLQDVLSQDAKQGQLLDATYNTDRPGGPAQTFPYSVPTQQISETPRPSVQTGLIPTGVLGQHRTRLSAQNSAYGATQQSQLTPVVLEPVVRRASTIGTVRRQKQFELLTRPLYFSRKNYPIHRPESI